MNFLLIAVCLAAGYVLRRSGILPVDAHKSVNAWILYIALPAVSLHYIPSIQWSVELLLPLIMPLVVWMGAWILLKLTSKKFHFAPETTTALLLTMGLGNTSFVGFPLTQAYYGSDGLRIAVVCDQMTFITLSTIGIVTAMHSAHQGVINKRALLKKIFLFPAFIAFLAAVIVPRFADLSVGDPLFEKLSVTLVPLALFSVGMQIHFGEWKKEIRHLAVGLTYKLIVAPALIFSIAFLLQITGIVGRVSVFEASMAPMITAAIVASEYKLDPKVANLMVSIGILISFITTGIWWILLRIL